MSLDALSLLTVAHWGFDSEVRVGRLVVATDVSRDVEAALRLVYEARFPVERMVLVDAYDASDDRSMADNNTSAFNCRPVTGGAGWSEHSYGTAIDVNPVQNPYVRGRTVLPPAGAAYLDRADVRPGMAVDPGSLVGAFRAIGWGWGGGWQSLEDFQHFSASGR